MALLDKDTDDLPSQVFLTDTKQEVATNKLVHAIQRSANLPISLFRKFCGSNVKNVTNVTNMTSVTTAMLKVVNVDRHIIPEQSPWETFDDIWCQSSLT